MNRKMVIPAMVVALYAMAQEPAQSADAVSRGWNQLSSGSGDVMEGFFTFVNRL